MERQRPLNVLSLFDGISCGQQALQSLLASRGVSRPVRWHASEICPYAEAVTMKHWPDTLRLGDVTKVHWDAAIMGPVDLFLAGFPCTDLTISKKERQGLEGSQSSLFWEAVRIWNEAAPTYWVFENVASMPDVDRDLISSTLGCEPVRICASTFGPCLRCRLFWTNIPISQAEVDALPRSPSVIQDILIPDSAVDGVVEMLSSVFFANDAGPHTTRCGIVTVGTRLGHRRSLILSSEGKMRAMTQRVYGAWVQVASTKTIRTFDAREIEMLQGLPARYTEVVKDGQFLSRSRRCSLVGLGFHVEVMKWILSHVIIFRY